MAITKTKVRGLTRTYFKVTSTHYRVFWPEEVEHYDVKLNSHNIWQCFGRSDGQRCWPYYLRCSCPHADHITAVFEAQNEKSYNSHKVVTLESLWPD